MNSFSGWSASLGIVVHTTGVTGSPATSIGALPGLSVNVYTTGTSNYATIYSSAGYVAPNPFLVNTDGSFTFYGLLSNYDLVFSTTTPTLVSIVTAGQGGTGQSAYTVGDLLYASAADALAKLAAVAVGQVLVSGGVGVAPTWSATLVLTNVRLADGDAGTPAYGFGSSGSNDGWYFDGTSVCLTINGTYRGKWDAGAGTYGLTMRDDAHLGWGNGSAALDTALFRDGAANTLAQKFGSNRQFFRVYGGTSNYGQITAGSGSPESVVAAVVGTIYLRTDGGANTTLYVKESGAGSTGWVPK